MPDRDSLSRLLRGRGLSTLLCGSAAAFTLLLSACGTSSTTGNGHNTGGAVPTATVSCPDASTVSSWHLVNSGQLTVASDTTYAPAEFINTSTNQPEGYDIDLAKELARRLCLTASIKTANFGDIIPNLSSAPLGQGTFDMSISSFTINDLRKQKVDMIPYFQAGESLLVPTGNPSGIKDFASMCGKTIAAQDNTVEQFELEDANGGNNQSGQAPVCKSNPIKIVHNPDENLVILAVINGTADASYQDSPVTSYYVSQHAGKLVVGGITVAPSPEGLVMRKDNPGLETAINTALTNMRTDGTYLRLLTAWGQQDNAYPPLS
ncbi:MAG: ABC transporter substrate-binding protein [Ktedonobacterales bacterium]